MGDSVTNSGRMLGAPAQSRSRLPRLLFLWTAAVVALAVAAGSGLAIAGIRHFESRLMKVPVGKACTDQDCLPDIEPGPCVREACNFLILGSDSREGLTPEEQKRYGNPANTQGQRADSILLVQTDVQNDRTIALSIPRDLRVEIPGFGANKINTALEHGSNVMVQTVEDLTGLEINHYLQIDFVGFRNLVDALGGVPVCIDRPLVDRLSNLNLPEAGCYTLDGQEALAFVRARHIEGDVIPDFSRIARQQQFTRAIIQEVLSAGAIFNYAEIVEAAGDNLVISTSLNLYALQDLTRRLADLGQRSVEFRTVPAIPVEIDGVSYVELIEDGAEKLFDRIRRGAPLGTIGRQAPGTPLSPANVTVRVLDAGSGGQAEEVATYLRRAGFVVLAVEEAPPELDESVLLFRAPAEREARVVGSFLATLPRLFDEEHTQKREITVVIAPDFLGLPES